MYLKNGALTNREKQVLKLIFLNNKDIAKRLVISPATVSTHLQNIRYKLAVSTRIGMLVEALKSGIIKLDEIEVK